MPLTTHSIPLCNEVFFLLFWIQKQWTRSTDDSATFSDMEREIYSWKTELKFQNISFILSSGDFVDFKFIFLFKLTQRKSKQPKENISKLMDICYFSKRHIFAFSFFHHPKLRRFNQSQSFLLTLPMHFIYICYNTVCIQTCLYTLYIFLRRIYLIRLQR